MHLSANIPTLPSLMGNRPHQLIHAVCQHVFPTADHRLQASLYPKQCECFLSNKHTLWHACYPWWCLDSGGTWDNINSWHTAQIITGIAMQRDSMSTRWTQQCLSCKIFVPVMAVIRQSLLLEVGYFAAAWSVCKPDPIQLLCFINSSKLRSPNPYCVSSCTEGCTGAALRTTAWQERGVIREVGREGGHGRRAWKMHLEQRTGGFTNLGKYVFRVLPSLTIVLMTNCP